MGTIFWLTGLSGAGKTTLATALAEHLRRERERVAVLDGDVLRQGLSRDLGFSAADRRENIRRAGEAALLLAEAGVIAVVALISPFRAERQAVVARARERGVAFAEIYVNAALAVCEHRDPKALYRRARAGELRDVTGIDSPYEPPTAPALELHTDQENVVQSTARLAQFSLALLRRSRHGSASVSRDS